ncbi:prepilin peptidase [Nocardioides nematodiphilus]|uniref:prepilin peptidase n=1 Tax=Nocardioides nematodiphilus TaxID=2849669 RepID=UPI001CD91F13|nr:A24 family peptidase [Nocardioides nematodiphilus]MCA1981269.1 prepilin peptidase [Nocardioides nematodiphilus]
MDALAVFSGAVAGLLGLAVGSFLNVVIVRVPRGESLLIASHCPHCDARIRPRHNVPVVSWLLLRGRCHDCRAPIPPRYPLIEMATALAFVAVTAWAGPGALGAALCLFAAASIALAVIDVRTHRLPDAIVGPSYVIAAVLLTTASATTGDLRPLVRGLAGLVLLGGGYYLVHRVRPDGMGRGDVKLAGLIGLVTGYVGWAALVVGGFAAFVLAGGYGIALISTGRAGRHSGLAFGPWMLAGGWVGLLLGTPVATGYLQVSGLA